MPHSPWPAHPCTGVDPDAPATLLAVVLRVRHADGQGLVHQLGHAAGRRDGLHLYPTGSLHTTVLNATAVAAINQQVAEDVVEVGRAVREISGWSATVKGVLVTRCSTVAHVDPAPSMRGLRLRLADRWGLQKTLPGRPYAVDGWHVTLARHTAAPVDAHQAAFLDERLTGRTIRFTAVDLVLTNSCMAESRTRVLASVPLAEAR